MQDGIDTLTFENLQWCMRSWETGYDRCIYAQGVTSKEKVETRIYGKKNMLMVKFPKFLGSFTLNV